MQNTQLTNNKSYTILFLASLQDLSFPTGDWTKATAVKASSPNHWTTREFPHNTCYCKFQRASWLSQAFFDSCRTLVSTANLWLQFDQDFTKAVASQPANSFPNKFIVIESDIWPIVKLFLTLVQIMFIKLKPLSASALLQHYWRQWCWLLAFCMVLGTETLFDFILLFTNSPESFKSISNFKISHEWFFFTLSMVKLFLHKAM